MIKTKLRLYILLGFLYLITQPCLSQTQATARLTILKGSSVDFIFNSMNKIQSGTSLNDWTQLRIYFSDIVIATGLPNPACNGWELLVKANTPNLVPEYGSTTIPLNVIQLKTHYALGDFGPFDLLSSDVEIANGGTPGNVLNATDIVIITYECGMQPLFRLTGYNTDFFHTELIFTLQGKY